MAFQRGRSKSSRSSSRRPIPGDGNSSLDQPRLLSPEKLETRARNVLLHQLARSAKSTSQLRKILEQREIPSEIAEKVLERFTEVGLIDDAAYAETIVNSRRNYKGLAKSAIKRELNEKGVSQELVEEAISVITAEDDFESAKQLAIRRYRQMAHLERDVRTRRLAGYLQRKGYSSTSVFAAIKFAEESYSQEADANQ
ncbi:regulatory protein RecX [Rhodoluna lacicola]|uniref:regulatory protein RecX n=1 Tax=Rhodoluna lacicola TaxID=529884 RepID=UPI0022308340|nr:regulatory protein RecX [Rhodoluna lacicola]BDS50194.1 regulatory protein RecX [Rhodoluna lacicola]